MGGKAAIQQGHSSPDGDLTFIPILPVPEGQESSAGLSNDALLWDYACASEKRKHTGRFRSSWLPRGLFDDQVGEGGAEAVEEEGGGEDDEQSGKVAAEAERDA